MKSIWKKIKFEFDLLGQSVKVVLKALFFIFILIIVYKITLPIIKYHLPKDLKIEEYENINGFVIIGLVFVTLIISSFFEDIFKNHKNDFPPKRNTTKTI